MKKVRVIENPKKGDYWDVVCDQKMIETALPYAPAYQKKLEFEKRIAAGQLIIPRKSLIEIYWG